VSHADEKQKVGREPCFLCELDLDTCSRFHPVGRSLDPTLHTDTTAAYNDNLLAQSENQGSGTWTKSNTTAVETTDTVAPPDGSERSWLLTDTSGAVFGSVVQSLTSSTSGNSIVMAIAKAGTSTVTRLYLFDTIGTFAKYNCDYTWAAGVPTAGAPATGSNAGVESLGDGWYILYGESTAIASGNAHDFTIYPDRSVVGGLGTVHCAGAMWHDGTTRLEYQVTEALDGTSTNIRLTTGGIVGYNTYLNQRAIIDATTIYKIERSHTGYVRVEGDASGEGIGTDIEIGDFCNASPTDDPCFNTFPSCQDTTNYARSTKTYKFAQPRVRIPGGSGYISSLRDVNIDTPMISRGEGFSVRGNATLVFEDHPHHDRGVDPYVAFRSYVPEEQGTYFGKWLARNRNYQNRVARIKSGYISDDGFDPTDAATGGDFETRSYLLDRFTGPSLSNKVTVTCKDALKPAADRRSQAPIASQGVLAADITDSDVSLTLAPTGIGDAEYPTSGTLRIGSEILTFTARTGDVISSIARGQSNTPADDHKADDTVQLCLVYDAARIDDVLYEQLVTYGNIDATYITKADWTSQVDEWLGSSQIDDVISEPTGVMSLVNGILTDYMVDMWWDDVAAQIRIKPLQPHGATPPTISDADDIVEDAMNVTDDPDARVSQVWVYYNRRDPTEPLDEERNYRIVKVDIDLSAESDNEYGEMRVEKIFSRNITLQGDALRLASRTLLARRDNPRRFKFVADASAEIDIGGYVTLDTRSVQDLTGANKSVVVYILGVSDTMGPGGHVADIVATDSAFNGRYGRIAPGGTPDYDAASDAEKQRYGFISEDTEPSFEDGEPAYLIV
jgi:hypothetical protein